MDTITHGLCLCGCGQPTPPATKTSTKQGTVKGRPVRFLRGHQCRKSPVDYTVEDRGYTTPCWIWQRGLHRKGYGLTHVRVAVNPASFITKMAHIAYWEERYGPVPDGHELDHLCTVRACVNPEHQEPVSHTENIHRSASSKLTWATVAAIRASTESTTVLMARYGVVRSTINRARSGRTYQKSA